MVQVTKDHKDYLALNAMVKRYDKDGKMQLEKDKESVRAYFLQEVNPNTMFFHSLEEKLDFLFKEGYYDQEVFSQYTNDFVKSLYKRAYAYKYRFPGFVSALKFYAQYSMKTFDGQRWIERWEDRVVANGLLLAGGDEELANSIVDEIMTGRVVPATPTFLNAGRKQRGEFSSCYLQEVSDDMNSIGRSINSALQLSKMGGGVAFNLTNVRAKGDPIKGYKGAASGVRPIAKLYENSFSYANQLGARQGAGAIYLNAHHLDIIDFLDMRKIAGDSKYRIESLSMGVVIPDITMKLLQTGQDMYLFSPYDVSKKYGIPFSDVDITEKYQEMVDDPNIRKEKISSRSFFSKIAQLQIASGYPFLMWEGNANKTNVIDGKIKQSNLCYSGDTKVLTDKGYVSAVDLYKDGTKIQSVIDARLKSNRIDDRGVFFAESSVMKKTAENTDIYQVQTKEGYQIKVTDWHKFFVVDQGIIKEKRTSELVTGDKLMIQSGQGSYGDFHDPELAYLMGVLAADGTYGEGSVRLDLYGEKRQWVKKIEESVASVIARLHVGEMHHSSSWEPQFIQSVHVDRLSLHSKPLADIFARYGVNKENKVSVPDIIWNADKETQCAFLSGIYQMDGSFSFNKKMKSASIEVGSINKKMLQDIQVILLNMGVTGRIYKGKPAGFRKLPDGQGGYAQYWCQESWRMFIQNRQSRDIFIEAVTMKPEDMKKYFEYMSLVGAQRTTGPKQHYTVAVESVEYFGKEDVYDISVPEYAAQINNGLVTHNCTEILQVQKAPVLADNQSYEDIGRDVVCNLTSLNASNLMNADDFGKTVDTAMRSLTWVTQHNAVTTVPSIKHGNDLAHAVGLGIMNLHGWFAQSGFMYGDEDSVQAAETLAYLMNYHSLKTSVDIAEETGESFDGFEKSGYADGTYFDQYINNPYEVDREKVQSLFANHQLPSLEDWSILKERAKNGVYHQNRHAIAPTGSISYINNATAGVMPIKDVVESRQEKLLGTVFYPSPGLNESNQNLYQDGYAVGWKGIIDVVAGMQKHIDQGISMELFFMDDASTKEINKAQFYAWKKGIKTQYYVRTRNTQLDGTGDIGCVGCSV